MFLLTQFHSIDFSFFFTVYYLQIWTSARLMGSV